MSDYGNIHYIQEGNIDKKKWDACIGRTTNGMVYAYSFYLDHMAKHWDAIVLNDYEAVMPLPWNRKYGIFYVYPPFLTPNGGVVGTALSRELIQHFISSIPGKFRYIEMNLNCTNNAIAGDPYFKKNHNYFLPLSENYTAVSRKYNVNLARNIKKAIAAGCRYENNIALEEGLHLATIQLRQYTRLQNQDLSRFRDLCNFLLSKKKASVSGVYLHDKLVSSAIFFYDKGRAFYILAGNSPEGKKNGSSPFLIDQFIQEVAGRNMILDFVGSDIPSIAGFYKSFGATRDSYPSYKVNRLPAWLKWAKK